MRVNKMPNETIKHFLEKFEFQALEWDGEEVTVFDSMSQPSARQEFQSHTLTWCVLAMIEDVLRRTKRKPFKVSL